MASICDEKCRICETSANGLHFGVLTCRACSEFFRRSIIDKKNYDCLRDGNCKMQKAMRYSCKFCRMKLCLLSGMKAECVQVIRRRQTVSKQINLDSSDECKLDYGQNFQQTILEMPPNQLNLIERMSIGMNNYHWQQKSLFTLLYPRNDPDRYKIVLYNDYIRMFRGCSSLIFNTLNDYFPLFSQLDLGVKESFMRTFNLHFAMFFQSYQTMLKFPAMDDSRFILHCGQLVSCGTIATFHRCNRDRDPAIRHTAKIADSCGRLVDKMRELNIRQVEMAAIIGIKMWNELAMLSKNMCLHADKERSRIYRDLYTNIESHYGSVKSGPRFGTLIMLLNDLDTIVDKMVEIFTMGKIFNLFELTIWDD